MLKGFWLNFVLTVAMCWGGLSTIKVVAELVEVDEEVELVGECKQIRNWTLMAWGDF